LLIKKLYKKKTTIDVKIKQKKMSLKISKDNPNRKIEEGQTTQWPNEKDKGTNNELQTTTQNNKDRVTRTHEPH
jgi:hypothetical protein